MSGISAYHALGNAIVASAGVKMGNLPDPTMVMDPFNPVIADLLPPVGDNAILLNVSNLAGPPIGIERFATTESIGTAAAAHLRTPSLRAATPAEVPAIAATLLPFVHVTAIMPDTMDSLPPESLASLHIAIGALQAGGSISVLLGSYAGIAIQRLTDFLRLPEIARSSAKFSGHCVSDTWWVPTTHNVGDRLFVVTATKRQDSAPTPDAIYLAMATFGIATDRQSKAPAVW